MLIAYVGPFTYPSSNANSLRIKGVVTALMMEGHEVVVCPGLKNLSAERECDLLDGPEIHQIDEYGSGLFSNLPAGVRGLFLGDLTIRWLQNAQPKPDVVILYGAHLGYLMRLKRYCQRSSIRFIVDVVEWYDPRQLPGGLLGPFAVANEIAMRWGIPRCDGILAISKYLEGFYKRKKCMTIRVPPLFSEFPDRPRQLRGKNGILNLCYAGTPGKKEEFGVLLEAIQQVLAEGVCVKLHIIGITEVEFLELYPNAINLVKHNCEILKLYGRIPNAAARQLVAASDFMIIARRSARFINAGFPFKVAESMSLGTPVIANRFSNLDEYLINNVNSFISNELTKDKISECIIYAAKLSDEAMEAMQVAAQSAAKYYFSCIDRHDITDILRK